VQAAITRKPWGDEADQRVTLLEALEGYTSEGAYAEFAEDRKGQLKPGFAADLVILDGDVFATSLNAIAQLQVVTTVCGGKITFNR
jgi:predicted amidohydrolase YtcJ